MRTINISDVKLSSAFLTHQPRCEKIDAKREQILALGKQHKPIIIDKNDYLQDGYATLLAMKELGYTECRYIRLTKTGPQYTYRDRDTTYIFGIHPTDVNQKEYVWRAPDSKRDSVYDEILPGDTAMVQTKQGLRHIVVTRIETLSTCPVDMRVRKYICKCEVDKS